MWYLFLCLAFLFLCFGIFPLISRKKYGRRKRFAWARTLGAVMCFLLTIITGAYLVLFPLYGAIPTTGGHAFMETTVQYEENRIETYRNDGSNRKISADIYWPSENGIAPNSCPLVVFSHGGMGYAKSNVTLYRELASHGYVVISIDHTYQCLWTEIDGKRIFINGEYMREIMSEDAQKDAGGSHTYYTQWMDTYMGDIDFVIDYAKTQAAGQQSFYGLIDPSLIAVMGHSLGGSAALGIGRTRDDVAAVIALESPFMYDIIGTQDGDFLWNEEPYPVPVLNLYTDSSYSHLGEWKQYDANQRLLNSQSPAVHNVHIEGCGHFSITDLALMSPILTKLLNGFSPSLSAHECLERVNSECLGFLDAYLK